MHFLFSPLFLAVTPSSSPGPASPPTQLSWYGSTPTPTAYSIQKNRYFSSPLRLTQSVSCPVLSGLWSMFPLALSSFRRGFVRLRPSACVSGQLRSRKPNLRLPSVYLIPSLEAERTWPSRGTASRPARASTYGLTAASMAHSPAETRRHLRLRIQTAPFPLPCWWPLLRERTTFTRDRVLFQRPRSRSTSELAGFKNALSTAPTLCALSAIHLPT